jgi:hypothetical protein
MITKDCIEIWQRATIREALPEEYKDKLRQELGREGNEVKYGSGSEPQNLLKVKILQDSNLAENSSVAPVEDVSEDFSQMNRGTDVITEK